MSIRGLQFFLACWGMLLTISLFAQSHTLSGYVQDAESGEKLIGANVYDPRRQVGTTTNRYGFYSLTIQSPGSDSLTLAVSYVGYQTFLSRLPLRGDLQLNINLLPAAIGSDTVQVVGEGVDLIENQTQMSTIDLPLGQIRALPALAGEVDVLKTLQLLPGVQSGNEGTSGLYVRGGGPDQNLILLDGAPVYNASHLFGFFSVFNSDAIKHVQITKGGFPARFGGRLSSVVEIDLKEGNTKRISGAASIGLVATRLTVEGPIATDKTAFIISGRRTYIDILAKPFLNEEEGSGGYYFYDLNAKVNHKFSEQDRLYLSVYTGRDRFSAEEKDQFRQETSKFKLGVNWGNITSTLRWNHILSKKMFSNTTLTYSKYRFSTKAEDETIGRSGGTPNRYFAEYFSEVRDWSARLDVDYIPNPSHYVKFGAALILHKFSPGAFQSLEEIGGQSPFDTTIAPSGETSARELSAFLEDDIQFSSRFSVNAGLHSSLFAVNSKTYTSLQPRLSARYKLGSGWAFKGSFVTMSQNIHLLTNSGIGLPTDLWVPATERVRPQQARQIALGIAKSLGDERLEFSVEAYHKTMDNLIDFKEGASFLGLDSDWQTKVVSGEGRSYGVELFLQKKRGATTGWLGYTLSRTERTFAELNFGKTFPYKFDRRHDLSLAVRHALTNSLEISGTWIYGTGNAFSLPSARFQGTGNLIDAYFDFFPGELNYYSERNGFRMGPYHRLDLSLQFYTRRDQQEKVWTISLYNVYNRKNPYFLFLDRDEQGERVIKQVSLFPLIPSISYRFTF